MIRCATRVLGLLQWLVLSGPCIGSTEEPPPSVAELKKLLRSKEEKVRDQALLELASIAKEESEQPRREVAEAAALALEDSSLVIRERAARFLGKDFHPEVAVVQLCKALDQAREDMARMGRGALRPPRQGDEPGTGGDQTSDNEQKLKVAAAIIESLGNLPDDRSVAALVETLRSIPPRSPPVVSLPLCRSLTELLALDGVEVVVQYLGSVESSGQSRGGRGPGGEDRDRARPIHDLLGKLAAKRKIEDVPQWGEQAGARWRRWLDQHGRSLPAKLGRVKIPKEGS